MYYKRCHKKSKRPSGKRIDRGEIVPFGEVVATLIEAGHDRDDVLFKYAFPDEIQLYFGYAEKHKMERERFKIIGMRFAFGANKKDWRKFMQATETRKKPGKAGEISIKDLKKLNIPVVYKDADRK